MGRNFHVSCSSDCGTAIHTSKALTYSDFVHLWPRDVQTGLPPCGPVFAQNELCSNWLTGRRGCSSCFSIGESTVTSSGPHKLKGCEFIQIRATKLVRRLKGMTCGKWLRTLGLSVLEKKGLRGDLIALCWFLRKGRGGADLSVVFSDWICGNGSRL